MNIGFWQIVIIVAIIIIIFGGKGKISSIFSELGKGIKSLRDSLDDKSKESNDKKNSKKK